MYKKIFGIVLTVAIFILSPLSFAQAAEQGENVVAINFGDISEHWSKDAVEELLKRNAIPFKGDSFMPEEAIKRSEFAVMLHNALGVQICYFANPDINDYFNDIDENAPYASDVIDLATAGIFEDTDSFKPDETLTREELVHYIMNAYKYRMGDNYAMIKIRPADFSDADKITLEYSVDVALAEHYGLVFGTGDNSFQPKKTATRAEAAAVTSRLIALLENQNTQVTVEPKAVVKDDSIEMSIAIKNNTKNDVYMYNANGQMFDFELLDADNNALYRWSADKAFIQMVSNTKIEAGKTLEFSDTLSGDTYNAIKDKMVYMRAYITGSADFINAEGYVIKL